MPDYPVLKKVDKNGEKMGQEQSTKKEKRTQKDYSPAYFVEF